MIDQLVAALGQELGLTSKEIADAVWLALQIDSSGLPIRADGRGAAAGAKRESDRSRIADGDFSNSDLDSRRDEGPKEPKSPEAELRTPNPDSDGQDGFGSDLMIKVPDARSLREPLALAKSLKPLLQKVTAGLSTVLNEAATVERIAGEGIWMPVLKPNLEPWLDLALVVDDSLSMHLWQRTITELQRLLGNYGVFRDVRVWSLATDDLGQLRLRPRSGAKAAQKKTLHRPSELVDPGGRRLILIATDCVSEIWHDGTMLPALKLWAASGPMAIVQMLPEWLWARTALGFASAVRLHSLMPGLPNQRLDLRGLSPWDEVDLEAGIRVPVVTLEPEPFLAWAKMVSSEQGAWATGFVFDSAVTVAGTPQLENSSSGDSAQQRVQRFRSVASPLARRLAGLLAAAPMISLPVVRIIQDQVLPESRQLHLAEVFLGGLLRPTGKIQVDTDPDLVQYDFLHGVREILLESVPTNDSICIVDVVSKFIAERLGVSLSTFAALLRSPPEMENQKSVNQSYPFAIVTAQILRQLGGAYAQFAEELEQRQVELQRASPTIGDENLQEGERLNQALLLSNDYLPRGETSEQRVVYSYIRSLAARPSQEAIDAFYRLLWDGLAYPHNAVQTAWEKIVGSPDFDQHRLKVVNRCYYTLANPWHLDDTRGRALEKLILWLEDIPSGGEQSRLSRKLRDTLRLYHDSDYYAFLKRHLYLLEGQDNRLGVRSRHYFGDLFPDYFFIYEAGTQTLDIDGADEDLNAGILKKRNRELRRYHHALGQFYIRYKRSSQADRVNPTHLSDEDLCRAIDLYRPKRRDSFKIQADIFETKAQQLITTDEFKRAAYEHVMNPVRQFAPSRERWFSREFQTTLDSLPNDVPLTRVVKIQLFRKLLNALARHDDSRVGGDHLYYLVTGLGSEVVTSIFLNIVLTCPMVRFDLEKRFAYLHHRFSEFKNEAVQWLVNTFDHVNVALALNAKYVRYFKLSTLRDGE